MWVDFLRGPPSAHISPASARHVGTANASQVRPCRGALLRGTHTRRHTQTQDEVHVPDWTLRALRHTAHTTSWPENRPMPTCVTKHCNHPGSLLEGSTNMRQGKSVRAGSDTSTSVRGPRRLPENALRRGEICSRLRGPRAVKHTTIRCVLSGRSADRYRPWCPWGRRCTRTPQFCGASEPMRIAEAHGIAAAIRRIAATSGRLPTTQSVFQDNNRSAFPGCVAMVEFEQHVGRVRANFW